MNGSRSLHVLRFMLALFGVLDGAPNLALSHLSLADDSFSSENVRFFFLHTRRRSETVKVVHVCT